MISEVDIRDWEQVDFQRIKNELQDSTSNFQYVIDTLHMVEIIKKMRDRQIAEYQKIIPALLRPHP